jgi:hypothetical protein
VSDADRRPHPDITDLVDQTGTTAIEHVLRLLERLEHTTDPDDPAMRQCREELRRLVSDIASLRNATSLLHQQQLDQQHDLDRAG